MKASLLSRLLELRAAKHPAVVATRLTDGRQALVADGMIDGDLAPDDALKASIARATREDRSRTVETADGPVFLHVHNPPMRLIVVGAVHTAQSLVPMAALTGYEVTVVDPRRAFATSERFAGVTVTDEWPDEALERLAPDVNTAVVTLTHDPKLDDPALIVALRSPAFYVGCLGSKKTHAKRLDRLRAAGFSDGELARLRGPVGLAIGAVSPAEIAISILAEIIQARHAEESGSP